MGVVCVKIVLSTWDLFVLRLAELYTNRDFGSRRCGPLIRETQFCAFVGRAIRISIMSVAFEVIYIWNLYIVLLHDRWMMDDGWMMMDDDEC